MPKEKKTKKINTERSIVYAGISVEKDGFWAAIRSGKNHKHQAHIRSPQKNLAKKISEWLARYSAKNRVKIIGAGISGAYEMDQLAADIWLKQDIVPLFLKNNGSGGSRRAVSAALEVARMFGYDEIIEIGFNSHREVRTVKLAGLDDYRKICNNGEFDLLWKSAQEFKAKGRRIAFFSSTPRGGGVALMRHSLIRLYRLLGVNAFWYVMNSKRSVFEITKKKFHNILQGVAPPEVRLNDGDKEQIYDWTRKNAERFREIFEKTGVIVIDDPQPSGLIPFIKKINPKAKIIYRSHIQIEADLVKRSGTSQHEVWNYLWNNVKKADIFVSHPVKSFIPATVPRKKVILMPASTDNLDGLNKGLTKEQMEYYIGLFNRELIKHGQKPLDPKRPVIIQIARFDPSKGIPDVIEAFRKLRKILYKENRKNSEMPQLVIAGHGSIDDPEAMPIYNGIMNILKMDTFKHFIDDIKVLRLPNNDQMLNSLVRRCRIALQLSHKEGFEIKVSEALEKGKPVIAYWAGGIPLQITHGVTGFLVKIGNTSQVAKYMHLLLTDKKKYSEMSKKAIEKLSHDYFAVSNAAKWLYIANELSEKGRLAGNMKTATELMSAKRHSSR